MQTGVRNGCKIAKRGTLNTKYTKLSDGGALIFRLYFIFEKDLQLVDLGHL